MIPFAAESLSRVAQVLYQERVRNAEARPRSEPGYDSVQSEREINAEGSGRRHRQ